MNSPETDILEETLGSYPQAELPAGFRNRVLSRVKQTPQMARFHLTWLDYALGLFLVSLPLAGWMVWKSLPPEFFLRLKFNWMLLSTSNNLIFLALSLVFFAAVTFVVLLRLLYKGNLSG